ncbi:hypothetical protein B9Z19DRAFT_415398 [Tuber borchii]|uniref:Uncharacterized protein n=1 Tax=Tuber borchii TaxID=42251 RepID=A0A2T7A3U9_TUBBO|nr:hypothetical protein B9Z19DRAFT_415398 [Tuber borchii]
MDTVLYREAHWHAIQEPQRVRLGGLSACYSSKSVNFLYRTYYYKPFYALLFPTGFVSSLPTTIIAFLCPPTAWLSSTFPPPSNILFHKPFKVLVYACVCVWGLSFPLQGPNF